MEDVIGQIMNLRDKHKTFIIGIDGLGGAGKTTYAHTMKRNLQRSRTKVNLLHMDDFIHLKHIRYNANLEESVCYYDVQWRYDYLIENILIPIRHGKEVNKTIEIYDKENDVYVNEQITIDRGTMLIIEGVFIQRFKLKPYFNYIIFLDVPKDERLRRVLHRDTYIGEPKQIKEKYETRYFPAEERYVSQCSPASNAHYLVDENL